MKLRIDKNSPVGLRLGYRFWVELGRPARFHNRRTLEAWAPKMESLWRKSGLDYGAFRWFLIWALRQDDPDGAKYGNDWTARNLRSAKDPMASLVKQFATTFFEIFMPKADKVIPLLIEVRDQEEATARLAAAAIAPTKWVDILPEDAEEWEIEKARFMDAQDAWDAACPVSGPLAGETLDEWIMREFKPLRNPDWRCSKCVYGISLDGKDDVRTKWCADCAEERKMDEDDDREWMCLETPSESCLTKEWD
jgi:hypothetical protein